MYLVTIAQGGGSAPVAGITGTPAPAEINCAPQTVAGKSYYKCGYGPVSDGGVPGPDPSSFPFPGNAPAMKTGDIIKISAAAGGALFEGHRDANVLVALSGAGAIGRPGEDGN